MERAAQACPGQCGNKPDAAPPRCPASSAGERGLGTAKTSDRCTGREVSPEEQKQGRTPEPDTKEPKTRREMELSQSREELGDSLGDSHRSKIEGRTYQGSR